MRRGRKGWCESVRVEEGAAVYEKAEWSAIFDILTMRGRMAAEGGVVEGGEYTRGRRACVVDGCRSRSGWTWRSLGCSAGEEGWRTTEE